MPRPHLFVWLLAGCAATRPVQDESDALPAPTDLAVHGKQVQFGLGLRNFEDPGYGRLDDLFALALDYCEPLGLESLRLEGGLHYTHDEADESSGGEDVRLSSTTFEISAGLNWSILVGRLRPYVGGGAAVLLLNLRGLDDEADAIFDDDDTSFGGYLKAGIVLQVTPTSHIGLEARHFEGSDINLDGTELGTSYDQFLIVFGTSLLPE